MKSSGSRPSSSPSSSPSPSPSRLIDVSNNAPLLLPSPDTTVAEPESERVHNYFLLDVPVTREQLSHYRNAAETARSELAALLVKYECAQAELLNLKSKLISKEVYIEEMKAEIGSYKENDARQSSLLISVQSRLQEIEKESGAFAILKKQADQKAQTILQENLEMKGKISELEAEIRKCLNESEEIQILACKTSREHHEFSAHLCNLFDMGVRGKEEPKELLLAKVGDMCKENAVLKGQIATLKETINLHEVESKANRETITRLVSELSRAQEKSAACSQDVEKLSDDLKINIKAKQSLEKEMRNLEDRLNAVQRAWEASQEELSLMKKCCSEKEEALKSTIREASAAKSLHNAFREQILALLRSNSIAVNLSTEDIVEKVREMCNKEESKNTYLKFLDQLSEKMNLDKMAADIGFDMRLDAVLARVEQLVKLEGDTLIENKIIARNLQRKLKTQKEQFDNKELQLKLLRQKIAQLEEEKHVRTALAVEKDEANLTVRKLQKKLERLQNELVLARETNTELKVKLADTNELKIKTLEQDKTIEDLSKSQENLEKLKAKAERQLTSVKSELHVVERDAKEDKEKAKNMLESVMNELTTLKSALEEVMKRKEQLSNFREVVSHMLGLNIATVTLPDYEITTRLEELIHAHQHHFVPCVCFKDEPLHFLH
ncbi:coiled-coil domain-containing protein 170 isoform X3 [Anolis carolinensis]|uniref:coiled-coil domain-containing protein 170 isoform X3 n=1 Tax=Anolis carolinensis TaxID=28377 RepID=UPI002F2B2C6C